MVLAALGVDEPASVIAEVGQHPGAENDAEPELAQADLSIPVSAKMLGLPNASIPALSAAMRRTWPVTTAA